MSARSSSGTSRAAASGDTFAERTSAGRVPADRARAPLDGASLDPIVDALCVLNESLDERSRARMFPSRAAVAGVVDDLRTVLYPRHFGASGLASRSLRYLIGVRLAKAQVALREQVRCGLALACEECLDRGRCERCTGQAGEITSAFLQRLPRIRGLLDRDVQAAFEGDPAARFLDETLFCYPGVTAILSHRLAHELHNLSVPLIPRIVAELAHAATGIDIHPSAQIGGSFFIDHGTGVVIGETCLIGERVRIYQGVTLGARSFTTDHDGQLIKGLLRHPIVEDDVVIYAGATILGRITIGRGASIGGNVWLTRSVPPMGRVTQALARQDTFENGSGI
jgi:serine O-acetyltransferase